MEKSGHGAGNTPDNGGKYESESTGIKGDEFGFAVADSRGGKTGVWHSPLFATSPAEPKDDKRFIIHTPDPDRPEGRGANIQTTPGAK